MSFIPPDRINPHTPSDPQSPLSKPKHNKPNTPTDHTTHQFAKEELLPLTPEMRELSRMPDRVITATPPNDEEQVNKDIDTIVSRVLPSTTKKLEESDDENSPNSLEAKIVLLRSRLGEILSSDDEDTSTSNTPVSVDVPLASPPPPPTQENLSLHFMKEEISKPSVASQSSLLTQALRSNNEAPSNVNDILIRDELHYIEGRIKGLESMIGKMESGKQETESLAFDELLGEIHAKFKEMKTMVAPHEYDLFNQATGIGRLNALLDKQIARYNVINKTRTGQYINDKMLVTQVNLINAMADKTAKLFDQIKFKKSLFGTSSMAKTEENLRTINLIQRNIGILELQLKKLEDYQSDGKIPPNLYDSFSETVIEVQEIIKALRAQVLQISK